MHAVPKVQAAIRYTEMNQSGRRRDVVEAPLGVECGGQGRHDAQRVTVMPNRLRIRKAEMAPIPARTSAQVSASRKYWAQPSTFV